MQWSSTFSGLPIFNLFCEIKAFAILQRNCFSFINFLSFLTEQSLLYKSQALFTQMSKIWEKIEKYQRWVFMFERYKAINISARSTPPMKRLYSLTIFGQDTTIFFLFSLLFFKFFCILCTKFKYCRKKNLLLYFTLLEYYQRQSFSNLPFKMDFYSSYFYFWIGRQYRFLFLSQIIYDRPQSSIFFKKKNCISQHFYFNRWKYICA